ncbi:hypothetical protein [Actinomadura nitritigenes]|uniref:hypothetical protein n=1 Tax=Actinomadura nitritigenes TaxID=134602 RepID=UPI003D8C771A
MKALRCTVHGSLDDLTVHEIPEPVAGPGQVVVEVRAAAVNFADILVVQGAYQLAGSGPVHLLPLPLAGQRPHVGQSGIGREKGVSGLEDFRETKTFGMVARA